MSAPVELTARVVVKDGEYSFTNFDGQEFLIETKKNNLAKLLSQERIMEFLRDILSRGTQDALVLSNVSGGRRKK